MSSELQEARETCLSLETQVADLERENAKLREQRDHWITQYAYEHKPSCGVDCCIDEIIRIADAELEALK